MLIHELQAPVFLPPPKQERAVGIHVSAIIRCIATETGVLKPEWAEELSLVDVRTITDPSVILRINIGLAWEQFYIPEILGLEGVIDHPGQLEVDGVYMSPDGESVDVIITESGKPGVAVTVHEVKSTYKSTNTVGDLSSQWMWMAQMKAYCRGMGTTRAQMHTLFLCGDYSYPITPTLKRWAIDFTQPEIDDNWRLLLDYKAHREKTEAEGGPPTVRIPAAMRLPKGFADVSTLEDKRAGYKVGLRIDQQLDLL
jgi:hypothetical protein